MEVTVSGLQLHYADEGEGLPCLVPTVCGTPLYRRTLSPSLRRHCRFIFLDLPGSGRSAARPVDEVTLDRLVDDMDQVRQALGFETLAMFGHSVHGFLALAYALRYPRHTSHVVIVGTPPRMATHEAAMAYWETMASAQRKTQLARNLAQLREQELAHLSPDAAYIRRYLAHGPQRFFDPSFDWAAFWEGCTFDLDMVHRLFNVVLVDYDPTRTFAQFQCPVFVAMGIYDYPLPPLLWAGEKDRFPNATYHVFERSGHWPHVEEQALFDATLTAWLAASSPPTRQP